MEYKEFKEKYEAWNEARQLAYLNDKLFDDVLEIKLDTIMVITIADSFDGPKMYINGCMSFNFRDIGGNDDPDIVRFYTGLSFNYYVEIDLRGFRWME